MFPRSFAIDMDGNICVMKSNSRDVVFSVHHD